MIGVMRWVGALRVIGPSQDRSRIWKDAEFPVRFEVEPLFVLEPEHGVPMDALAGKVCFYSKPEHKGKFDGFVRRSPNRFKELEDGALIMTLLEKARTNPVARPVDPKKLAQKPFFSAERQKGKTKETLLVSIPESEEKEQSADAEVDATERTTAVTRHTEIQYALLKLGSDMGMELWVARNDRSRHWNGVALGQVPGIIFRTSDSVQ